MRCSGAKNTHIDSYREERKRIKCKTDVGERRGLSQLFVLFLQIRSLKTPNSYGEKRVFSTERRWGRREAFSSEGASDTPTSTSETPPRDTSFPSRFPENGLEVSAPRAPHAFCRWQGGPRGHPPGQPGLRAGQERDGAGNGGWDRGQPREQPWHQLQWPRHVPVTEPHLGVLRPTRAFRVWAWGPTAAQEPNPAPLESPHYRTDARILAPALQGQSWAVGTETPTPKTFPSPALYGKGFCTSALELPSVE